MSTAFKHLDSQNKPKHSPRTVGEPRIISPKNPIGQIANKPSSRVQPFDQTNSPIKAKQEKRNKQASPHQRPPSLKTGHTDRQTCQPLFTARPLACVPRSMPDARTPCDERCSTMLHEAKPCWQPFRRCLVSENLWTVVDGRNSSLPSEDRCDRSSFRWTEWMVCVPLDLGTQMRVLLRGL